MHHIARETDAAVMLLHHTTENEGRPDLPPARKAIQGKIAQLPEMIVTVALVPQTGEFRVACVKNRFAANSADGSKYVTLWSDPSRMSLHNDNRAKFVANTWSEING
jgi:hypothetical protein